MSAIKTVKTIAIYSAIGLGAYATLKIVQAARDGVKAGGKVVDSVVAAAKEVVTTDLNPASDQNLAYRAANAVGGIATGDTSGSFSLGGWIHDLIHGDAWEKVNNPRPGTQTPVAPQTSSASSSQSDLARQGERIAGPTQASVAASNPVGDGGDPYNSVFPAYADNYGFNVSKYLDTVSGASPYLTATHDALGNQLGPLQ